ncbi:MAG TPA: mechanosensitive ion channel domain-containing protein, partial [Casimicrobiaceae bacterium]|nr:mechanosensitive ion channel domain-containing protein [Casimicrobiaceae bacterium]
LPGRAPLAQLPGPLQLPKPAAPAEKQAPVAASPDSAAKLAEVRAKLAGLNRPETAADGSPPNTPDAEIGDRIRLLHQTERSLTQRIDGEARHAALVRARRDADARADAWRGFDDPPPYALPFVDELEDAQGAVAQQIATLEAREKVLEGLGDRLQQRLRDSEAELRLASERVERARSDADQRRARWLRDLAQLRSDEAAAALDEMKTALSNATEEKGAAQAELRLATAKVAAARASTRFTQEDLDRVTSRVDADVKVLNSVLDRSIAEEARQRRAAEEAVKRLDDARKAGAVAGESAEAFTVRIGSFERAAELAQRRAENANITLESVRTQLALDHYMQKAWATRYELAQTKDLPRAAAAYENLVGSLTSLQSWNEYQRQQLDNTTTFLATLEVRLRSASADEAAALRDMRDVYVQRESTLRSAIASTQPLERLLSRWRAAFGSHARERPFAERVADALIIGKLWAKKVWDFELFSVEDSFETAEGRKVAGQRSVTIGKTVGALLLIFVGYWLCLRIAKLARWASVRIFRNTPEYASIVYRWLLAFLVTLLIVFSLLAVQIPLTVFAFLGGALAIGVGFGAQNLLKNIMSGIMLLVEKPLRVGDLIEFGNIRGRVTNIGFRASIVRTADGFETHIPNSTFIENNVTNLTYSSTEMRQKISIGVAYGVDPATVRKILLSVADDHAAVLRTPAPAAYFDEFGDDAQQFRLTYWIDAMPDLDTAAVATELRELIVARLAAANIPIPYPQRTVHVDTPVVVEIAQPRAPQGKTP